MYRAVHVAGFAARAAYLLGPYLPSLEGIFMAFTNTGYSASLINVLMVTEIWCVPLARFAPTDQPAMQPRPALPCLTHRAATCADATVLEMMKMT